MTKLTTMIYFRIFRDFSKLFMNIPQKESAIKQTTATTTIDRPTNIILTTTTPILKEKSHKESH